MERVGRWLNGYGDTMPWSVETRGTYTLLSFLRVRKYPPSLVYLLMTLGPLLIALAWLEHARGRVFSFFVTYGRVPLLFYVAHIYLVHLVAVVVCVRRGRLSGFPSYERRTNGRAPVVVWSRSWLGLRGLGFDRDRSLPAVPGFCQSKSSSPGLVVELLIAPRLGVSR